MGEYIHAPLLPGQIGNHPGLNGRIVSHQEGAPILRHQCRSDKLGQDIRHRIIAEAQGFQVAITNQLADFTDVLQVILREVLRLDDSTGPPP